MIMVVKTGEKWVCREDTETDLCHKVSSHKVKMPRNKMNQLVLFQGGVVRVDC